MAAAGIRIWFQRTANLYTMSDSTTITSGEESREPGIPSPYHILLAYFSAISYCVLYKKDRVPWFEKKWDEGIKDMLAHFGKREKDKRKIMTMKSIEYT